MRKGQETVWNIVLDVCKALPAGTFVTHSEFTAAVEATQANRSFVRHGRVVQGQVAKPDSVGVGRIQICFSWL